MYKVKVGDKVVPVSKSIIGPLKYSIVWQRAIKKKQPFLFVVKIDGQLCFCHEKYPSAFGDFFLESDLLPFEEVQARIEPKAPVYYTLPDLRSESKEPDYKGFFEFVMQNVRHLPACSECRIPKYFCKSHISIGCTGVQLIFAECKFIKKGKK